MFTKVCDELSTKLSVKHFGELLAMIGLDALDTQVFNQCVTHKSPDGDLCGDQIFTLAGMELTLDCEMMRSTLPIQCIKTLQASQNATLSTIGIGWHV
jgi:hypothetical protein